MSISVVRGDDGSIGVSLKIWPGSSMLDMEGDIQGLLNETGCQMTAACLEHLDTDGSVIRLGHTAWYSKGKMPKKYRTPYGAVSVERHVYQRSGGGKTWKPMEQNARLVGYATPKFAQQVSHKFANLPPRAVQRDLEENHGRKVAVSDLQKLADAVAAIVQAKEEFWDYQVPELDEPVETIAFSLDGTCMLMCDNGWREAMAGSLSLYGHAGKRLHTIYLGATPEYGKHKFLERLAREISRLKQKYPDANTVGIADGAQMNRDFLEQHTQTQILDFYHAASYLGTVAKALHPKDKVKGKQWLVESCHALKHEKGAAENLYGQMAAIDGKGLPADLKKKLSGAVTYFKNQKHRMNYPDCREKNYPIGSGVIEAACKKLIKQRLCLSGMRWKEKGAAAVLSLRTLMMSETHWQQFWNRVNRYGIPVAGDF